jgi:hypothetical protein
MLESKLTLILFLEKQILQFGSALHRSQISLSSLLHLAKHDLPIWEMNAGMIIDLSPL